MVIVVGFEGPKQELQFLEQDEPVQPATLKLELAVSVDRLILGVAKTLEHITAHILVKLDVSVVLQ